MSTVQTSPEITDFVLAVRVRLADLTEEEREELTGGLEADLADLVDERGLGALPDPASYAAELRSAAGFGPEAPTRRRGLDGRRDRAMAWLDRGRATWDRWVDTGDHLGVPALLETLRPVWWVLRACCAAALVCEALGGQGVYGLTLRRGLLVAVLVVLSVQLGREAWWPGARARTSLVLRTLLVLLNLLAVLVLPVAFARFLSPPDAEAYVGDAVSSSPEGLSFDGQPISNVYPYDAQGRPLTGVQLVDAQGRRLRVTQDPYGEGSGWEGFALAPWLNGRTQLFSVFPLAQTRLDPETGARVGDARLQTPPFASLPPVSLAGAVPSRVLTPTEARRADRLAARERARVADQRRRARAQARSEAGGQS